MIDDVYKNIFLSLDEDSIILTPNRRLAATLHKHYQRLQASKNNFCFETPDILPLSNWIQRLWSNYTREVFASHPLLLNGAQEQFLWEKILLESKHSDHWLQLSETANLAQSAWRLLKQWNLHFENEIFSQTEDCRIFQTWALAFQQYCLAKNLIEDADLMTHVLQLIENTDIHLPKKIFLVGFLELTPQFKHFFAMCSKRNVCVEQKNCVQVKSLAQQISVSDDEAEILLMARWAKTQSQHSIACVFPQLDKIRDRVLQIFSEVFADKDSYPLNTVSNQFNISAGKPLLKFPILRTAIIMLNLHKNKIPFEDFCYLLASPYLGEAEKERVRRAVLDSMLRRANVYQLNVLELLNTDKRYSPTLICPHLAKRLHQFFKLLPDINVEMTFSAWGKCFNQLLTCLGWPGERSVNSEEHQVIEQWLSLFNTFNTLDQVSPPQKYAQALRMLQKLLSNTSFQPQTPETGVQILGLLEAAALPFDAIWIAGMDDLSWPPAPRPHPFIPKQLQRELMMPHSTALRELNFSKYITQQFMQSASHVIFSYTQTKESLALQASSLICHLPSIDMQSLNLPAYQAPIIRTFESKKIQMLVDNQGPPVNSLQEPAQQSLRTVLGGINVIKQQALCPFKAFAEWRLYAQPLESPLPGLRAKDRGTLMHKILEIVWQTLADHATLIQLPAHELNKLIENAINKAFKAYPDTRYYQLEQKRMHKLVSEWLNLEKTRPPFKVVSTEQVNHINLNKLKLAIKIDRIDELTDGKKLIIDYKTSKTLEMNSWFSERIDEPQLPVYALLNPEQTIGICFAQINAAAYCFKGVSQYALAVQGIKSINEIKKSTSSTWQEQLNQWQSALEKLSDEFYHGIAIVDPKDETTCTWCALTPFCRIHEEKCI